MFTQKYFERGTDAKCFFRGHGTFGEIQGETERGEGVVFRRTDDYLLQCKYTMDAYGVCTRDDSIQNVSDRPLDLQEIKSRFVFEGGEYQVYTQYCCWQTESRGAWHKLTTAVSVGGASIRTNQNGAPFIALWSEQEQRGVAIHLLPNAAWEIKAERAHTLGKNTKLVVTLGISSYNFNVTLSPGEVLQMPKILCYEFKNKLDMDCYKLHNYLHIHYPRREMPIIYDTWMCCFDHLALENIMPQVDLAAEMGVEYFFIDAGWFGKGKIWSASVGDWSENTVTAFQGRMIEVADRVREKGMKFGLWIEPERAAPDSDSVKMHPEFYIRGDVESDQCFLDFANQEAREWMLGVIDELIERYGIAYIKDDFNANLYFDPYHTAFLQYQAGHKAFMKALRERHPEIYLSSCASGGMRMNLTSYTQFDSNWPSDNENPYDEMEIYKNSLLRLPPQIFERWVAIHSLKGYESFYRNFSTDEEGANERLIACGDAVWQNLVGVLPSYLKGYMTGGPIGLSCDLTLLSDYARKWLQEYIGKMKESREFWKTAVARILCDTDTVTVYQYSDMALSRVVVQLFMAKAEQNGFRIYPVLDESRQYCISGGEILSGKEIAEEGISLEKSVWDANRNEMIEVALQAI